MDSIWFTQADDHSFAGLRAGWRLAVFLLIAVGVPLLLAGLVLLAGAHRAHGAAAPAIAVSPLGTLGGEAFVFGWILLVSWILSLLEHRHIGDYGLPWRQAFRGRFWMGVLWGAVAMSVLLVLIFVSGGMSFGQVTLNGASLLRFGLEWAAAFLAVGFFEEFTFRGYALTTLTSGTGFWIAAVIVSIVFGGVHLSNGGENWIGALSAGLIGLFFCFTWRRTGSLWFAIGLHAMWDYCESFVYGVPDSGNVSRGRLLHPSFHGSHWITGGSVGPEGSLWVFLIIGLLFLLFAKLYPARQAAEARAEMVNP
ncbi:MAG: lysostaphin resistance A-like protein [Terriglobales bacterium]